MKIKILWALLVISIGLNIVGLVFFIRSLRLEGTLRAVKHERNIMRQNLTAVRASGVVSDAVEIGQVMHRTFASLADGRQDSYAFLPPSAQGRLDYTLLVYLHGMGSNDLEPFTCPIDRTIAQGVETKYPDVAILSCNYRNKASWGSDLAMDDVTQNIRAVIQEYPFKRIILMGTSMGGCTVLTYATEAPADIKSKITGIVSVEGAGDLAELCNATQNDHVKQAIISSLGGTYSAAPAQYERKSFLPNIRMLGAGVRVAVISAAQDTIVPPRLQDQIVKALENHRIPVKLISIGGGHGAPPATTYVQGLDFAMGDA